MGTRSRLGVVKEDGLILSVYCHWDGYPDYLGVQLESKYDTDEKIHALMAPGDLSAIHSDKNWENDPHDGPLYYSDKGESCSMMKTTHERFLELCEEQDCEYFYLFKGGQWIAHYSDGEEIPRDEWGD